MAAIVDNLIRTKRAAAVLLEDARKAAALPMEIFFAGMTGDPNPNSHRSNSPNPVRPAATRRP